MALTHYQLLGISPDSDVGQIKSAYRRMAKLCHPDTNSGSEAAAELFRQINEAYRVLGNPKLRQNYDVNLTDMQDKRRETNNKSQKPDPKKKFNSFLNSVLDAILDPAPTTIKKQPEHSPAAHESKPRRTSHKPDFNFYYYLAMERKRTPYSRDKDGIYRRTETQPARNKTRNLFNGIPGTGLLLILLSGLWSYFRNL